MPRASSCQDPGPLRHGPGEFRTPPHDTALDPQGRLFVADRGNIYGAEVGRIARHTPVR
jgi:hypothetical protein